jgi:long-subunit fatty acid transport protein
MKKGLLFSSLVLGLMPPAAAGGIFYNSNQSAEYIRTFDRNSARDNADIVYYNMAATPLLADGWTFNVSNQAIFQRATVQTIGNPVVGDKLYRSNNAAPVVPNFFMAYKKDDWAAFLGVETIGATAIREWKDGLPTLDLMGKQMAGYGLDSTSQVIGAEVLAHGGTPADALAAGLGTQYFPSNSYLKGSSYYIAVRAGGAWRLSPMFSVAVAARYVTSQQTIVGSVDGYDTYNQYGYDLTTHQRAVIDLKDKATGFSGEVGFNFYPNDETLVSLTYEMATPLNFKTTVNGGKDGNGLFVDGTRAHLDLPRVVRFGLGHQMTPELRLSMGVNAYLESSVNFSKLDNAQFGIKASDAYRNTYEESAAIEYKFNPRWIWSFGVNFNQIGQRQNSTIDISLPGAHANYFSQGTGFQYSATPKLKLNVGLAHTAFMNAYENADAGDRQLAASFATQGVTIAPTKRYNKEYFILAIGVDFHF